MKTLKIIALLSALLMMATALLSCGTTAKTYKDDVKVELLYKNAEQVVVLGKEELSFRQMGDVTLSMLTGISDIFDENLSDDYIVRYTGSYSCDEYGILHFKSAAEAQKGETAIKTYLKSKADDTTQRSYFGEEAYKFDESEVKIYGNYVAYAIFTESNRKAFFNTIEQLLSK